jgi:hypothetical protein
MNRNDEVTAMLFFTDEPNRGARYGRTDERRIDGSHR